MRKLLTIVVAVFVLFSSFAAYAVQLEVTNVSAPADFLVSADGTTYQESLEVEEHERVYIQATLDMTPVQTQFLTDYNKVVNAITPEGETEPDGILLEKFRQSKVTGAWTLKLTYPNAIVMPTSVLSGEDMAGFNPEAKNTFVEVSRAEIVDADGKVLTIEIKVKDNCTVAQLKDSLNTMLFTPMTFTAYGVKSTEAKTCEFIATFSGTTAISSNQITKEYTFTGVKNGEAEIPAELIVRKYTSSGVGGGQFGVPGLPIPGEDGESPVDPDTPVEPDIPVDPSITGVASSLNTKDHFAYIEGYPDGTVRPEDNITRAEATTVIYRLLNAEKRESIFTTENTLDDVTIDLWYNKAVSSMNRGGYVVGYEDGNFYGDNSITRAELVTILARFANANTADVTFTDVDASHWAYEYIATAVANKWLKGYEDGSFRPEQMITRAEAATMINRALNRGVGEKGILEGTKEWPDNAKTAWYYYEMLEATNDHTYTGSRPSEVWNSLETDYVYDIVYFERP